MTTTTLETDEPSLQRSVAARSTAGLSASDAPLRGVIVRSRVMWLKSASRREQFLSASRPLNAQTVPPLVANKGCVWRYHVYFEKHHDGSSRQSRSRCRPSLAPQAIT